jgi:phasin family protein
MTRDEKHGAHSLFGEIPAFDFDRLMQHYKLPGVDMSQLVEREKRNIEALTRANRIALEGWRALVARQSEILRETMAHAMVSARQESSAKNAADLARLGFERALDSMRELAEMAARSQQEAYEVVRKRIHEEFEELRAGEENG